MVPKHLALIKYWPTRSEIYGNVLSIKDESGIDHQNWPDQQQALLPTQGLENKEDI